MPLSQINSASIENGAVAQVDLSTNVAGNGPAFRAYLSANQTVSSAVVTKILINTKIFDTADCFSTSLSRFTPTVAGYYQINAVVGASAATSLTYNYIQIYKNGARDSIAIYGPYASTSSYGQLATLIYLNGTTDYIELYAEIAGTGTLNAIGANTPVCSYISGFLARAA